MRAIILAAGRGSRMGALTLDRPKCLAEIQGRTLLTWQIDALRGSGIDEIAIVTGYRREMVAIPGLVEFHNPRWAETNMVASLECATQWLDDAACLVSYSDIFYTNSAVESLLNCPGALAITYDPNWQALWQKRFGDPLVDAETFRLRPDGTLAEIGGKPSSLSEVEGQYMGLLRIEPTGWQEMSRIRASLSADQRDQMHMTDTLQLIVARSRLSICAIAYYGNWGEIDSPHDLAVFATE